jgi:hypothetical protein
MRTPEQRAKSARVSIAQNTAVIQQQIDMIVLFWRDSGAGQTQTAGHAEVHDQSASIQSG